MLDAEKIDFVLKEHQNKKNQEAMEAYQRNQFTFYGVKSDLRKKLTQPMINSAKNLLKEQEKTNQKVEIDWKDVSILWGKSARENQYVAADYLKSIDKYLTLSDLEQLENLIITKSWWDSVDVLVKRVGSILLKYPEAESTIYEWAASSNIWLNRSAIICQLGLKKNTNLQILNDTITMNFGKNEFFINKAIGWALRDYAKTDANWTKNYVEENTTQLNALSIREALKNIN